MKRGKIKELVFLQRGFDITKAQQKDGPYPVVSSSGIQSFHSEFKVEGPGVVIGRKGSIGSVYFVEGNYWPHDTTLWSKDLLGNEPKYVYYFFKTLDLEGLNVGAANPTLNRNHIHELPALIPGIARQRRVASVLSAYDDLIDNNIRRIKLLEETAKQLYKEWFVRLRFPGYEHTKIRNGVPEGWEKKPTSSIVNIQSGGTPSTQVSDYWDGEIPFYTPKDHTNSPYVFDTERSITEAGLKNCNSKLYPKNTIFISARGTVGKLTMAQRPMAMSQTSYALNGKGEPPQLFLYCSLVSSLEQFQQRAVGAVFDTIIMSTFDFVSFLVPTKIIISEFENLAGPLFNQIDNLLQSNRKLRQSRDILLPRLMKAKIEV